MSNRTDIIDAIVSAFRDISGIGEVSREFRAHDQIEDFPALFVNAGSETYRHNAGNAYDSEMEILVVGYVKDEDDRGKALDGHLVNTIKAVAGLNLNKFLKSCEIFERFYPPYAIFELALRIDYDFTLLDP